MKPLPYLAMVVAMLTLSGCANLYGLFAKQQPETEAQLRTELDIVNSHLLLMREITTADYQRQVRLFEQTSKLHREGADKRSTLRYALALTASGHPNSDPGRGYSELSRLMDEPGTLTPLEVNLARVILNKVESIMILEARNTELKKTIADTQAQISKSGRSNRVSLQQAQEKLDEALLDIDTLSRELAEAQAKLDAIKNIEVTSE